MSGSGNIEFFGDASIRKYVEELWADVFEASSKVIGDAEMFGFEKMDIVPNPNIHQILSSLTVIDSMLDMILATKGDIDTNDARLIFNAKQQILTMGQIATALNRKDRTEYDEAIARLNNQAPI